MKTFAILIFLASVGLLAQDRVVEESLRVQMVSLDVRVTTLAGKMVTGLSVEDLTVYENDRPQTIDSFEEVIVEKLAEEDLERFRPRFVLLIDFETTLFRNMRFIFSQLTQWIEARASLDSEIAIAINADGVKMIQEFTTDREVLLEAVQTAREHYRGVRNRWAFINRPGAFSSNRANGEQVYLDQHYIRQVEVYQKFVNYLGAYRGTKNVVILSDVWRNNSLQTTDYYGYTGNPVGESLLDLKAIQTACLLNKVTLNTVTTRGVGIQIQNEMVDNGYETFTQPALSAMTGGLHYRPNSKAISGVVDRVVDQNEHYYRIRYYSNSDTKGFRRVRVAAGVGRVAYALGGYHAAGQKTRTSLAGFEARREEDLALEIEMPTDWLTWIGSSITNTYETNFVVSQRVFDDEGRVLTEKVAAVALKRKGRDSSPRYAERVALEVSPQRVARIVTTVIDLVTGERFVTDERFDDDRKTGAPTSD